MKEYLLPTRVVNGDKIENAETLLRSKGLYATINYNVEDRKDYLKMEGMSSFIVLDFGKEMNGGIRMITNFIHSDSCKIRIRFGESLGEVNANIKEKNASLVILKRLFVLLPILR